MAMRRALETEPVPNMTMDLADSAVDPDLNASIADGHSQNVQTPSNADDHWDENFPLPTAQTVLTMFQLRPVDRVPRKSQN